jgi:hypothetical protein
MITEYEKLYLDLELNSQKCPHCRFISQRFLTNKDFNEREYWLMTEVFCYLHGSDGCNGTITDNQKTKLIRSNAN